jgi:recombination associated protein RdgC
MTWKDRISFVLTDRLQIKRVAFVNILDHEPAQDAENEQERFALDFALMTGEFASFLVDLVRLLGGEKAPAG